MNSASNNKYKKPKQRTRGTTNPGSSRPRNGTPLYGKQASKPLCPLLAKDSEWVDNSLQRSTDSGLSSSDVIDAEEVLQLVECEDGPQMKPLAIMFPDLIEKDPQTLQGVLNRAMSTTEVTRHLVDLGQKANFTFMKKADRLIPKDKKWMESVTENSSSYDSVNAAAVNNSTTNEMENREIANHVKQNVLKRKRLNVKQSQQESSSRDSHK